MCIPFSLVARCLRLQFTGRTQGSQAAANASQLQNKQDAQREQLALMRQHLDEQHEAAQAQHEAARAHLAQLEQQLNEQHTEQQASMQETRSALSTLTTDCKDFRCEATSCTSMEV